MKKVNPLMMSLADILIIEWHEKSLRDYDELKFDLGDQFEPLMASIAEDIEAMRKEAAPGTTILEAAMILAAFNQEDGIPSVIFNKHIRATARWMELQGIILEEKVE